jgi:tail tube protein
MSIGSGLAAQIGIANESVVNTPVAVTTFTEFTSEGLEARPNFAQGVGLRGGGLVARGQRRSLVSIDAGGPVVFDLATKGMGKWMQACMGSYTTTATVMTGSAYQQIHNLGSADGKTFTLQKGAPSIDGTVNPLTLGGCKVMDWTLTSGPNAIASLALTVDAMSIAPTGASALALQAASYSATNSLFAFNQATVSSYAAMTVVSGVWTPTTPATMGVVRNLSLKGGQPKDNTRWQAGSTTKAEALVNDFQPITGQIDIDFASMALYNQFVANTAGGIQIAFTGSIISGSTPFSLTFNMPASYLESGSTPKVGGPGIITVSYPITSLDDGTNGALQCVIVSSDTTV